MPKRLTTEEFIEKAKYANENKYDYSLVKYINSNFKVEVICNEHGSFLTRPADHIRGHGCPKCSDNVMLSKSEFIARANIIHNNFYDYSKVEYKGNKKKIEIICKEHGSFLQKPNSHLLGQGCAKCSNVYRKTTEEYVQEVSEVHDYKYNYSLVKYKNSRSRIKIICQEHGEFELVACNHLNGSECPGCIKDRIAENRKRTYNEFLKDAKELHGEKYTYCFSKLVASRDTVNIVCPIHGKFEQKVSNHLANRGCSECGKESCGWTRTKLKELVHRKGKGILYILRLFNEDENFVKIGITTRTIKQRVLGFPYNTETIHKEILTDGALLFDLERYLLRTFKKDRHYPRIEFGGITECFNLKILEAVIKEIYSFKENGGYIV